MKRVQTICERCENEREVQALNDQMVCYDCWAEMGEEAFFPPKPYRGVDQMIKEFEHDKKS